MDTEVTVETVTPEMAQQWLTQNRYEHQRSVRPNHVKYLVEEIQRNAFKQDTPIEFCSVDDDTWLTDGQHRLTAVILAQVPQRFVIVRRRLSSQEAVANDYIRTDQNVLRTVAEAYKTLNLEAELGLTPTQLNFYGVAVAFINQKFIGRIGKMHPDDRLRLMRDYNDAYGAYLEAIAGVRHEWRHRFDRAATLSVALITYRYSAKVYGIDRVDDFWHGAAMDDGLNTGDPRKTALRHLVEVSVSGGYGAMTGTIQKQASSAFSARYLATCFNAFIEKKVLKFAKPAPSAPMLILGSPFTGK
jgi:hypothetical protein